VRGRKLLVEVANEPPGVLLIEPRRLVLTEGCAADLVRLYADEVGADGRPLHRVGDSPRFVKQPRGRDVIGRDADHTGPALAELGRDGGEPRAALADVFAGQPRARVGEDRGEPVAERLGRLVARRAGPADEDIKSGHGRPPLKGIIVRRVWQTKVRSSGLSG